MTGRTIDIFLSNETSQVLSLRDQTVETGTWVIAPPLSINPGGKAHWRSVSIVEEEDPAARLAISVDYTTVDRQTWIRLHGVNPGVGQNLFHMSVSGDAIAGDPSGPVHNSGGQATFIAALRSRRPAARAATDNARGSHSDWLDGLTRPGRRRGN